jgi:hypothetical protein
MNFKFGYSWSPRGSFVTDTNSKRACFIGGEEEVGAGEGGGVKEVSGILTRI